MSNRRIRGWGNTYRTGYLRSRTWFQRRDQWFADERAHGAVISCAACGREAKPSQLELHHNDYRGVIRTERGWVSRESHRDLVPLHPLCHELLHRLLERDRVLGRMRTRRDASTLALVRLRQKLSSAGTT